MDDVSSFPCSQHYSWILYYVTSNTASEMRVRARKLDPSEVQAYITDIVVEPSSFW